MASLPITPTYFAIVRLPIRAAYGCAGQFAAPAGSGAP
jgi:hypothetical protein